MRSALPVVTLALMCPGLALAQEMMPAAASSWTAYAPRATSSPARSVTETASGYLLHIYGNQVPNVYGGWATRIQGLQGARYYRFRARAVPADIASLRESITIVLRWRGSFGDEVTPDYVWDYRLQTDGSLLFDRVIQAPTGTTAVDVNLVLQWSAGGRVSFDALSLTPAAAPAPRPVRVVAVHYRPSGTSSGYDSVRLAAQYADQVAATHQPDVMVLGETLNVIGAPGTLDQKAETVPGPSTDLLAAVARSRAVYIAFGILERSGTELYNAAVLLDRGGAIVGKYRKVQLPLSEASGGVAPGSAIPVFDTELGRIALLVCQDMAFPEPAREAALQGAELLLVPIWGGKPALVRARAAEHGVYVAASGYDYATEVIGPLGTVLAAVSTISSPGAAVANVDLSVRFRETWLGEMRDLSNKERRASPYQRKIDEPPGGSPPVPPPDTTPPSISLTAPASGATVAGTVTIAAAASDDVAVVRVRFLVDGAQLGSDDTTAPYSATWDTRTVSNASHTIAATAYDAAGNSNTSSSSVTVSNSPVTALPIPGTIQAEDYDAGGEGVAYHDTTTGNSGGQYRSEDVDIEATRDSTGAYNVGWMAPGEWLQYGVSVQAAGTYTLTARVAASGAGGTFHVEAGGTNVTGPLAIPNTGGWQTWTNVTATVTLRVGPQAMRVVVDTAGPTGAVGNLNYVRFDATSPPATSDVVLYASNFTRHGNWALQADATAAGGQKAMVPDAGQANTSAPLASPADFVEATFNATAGTPYTIWLRMRATSDSKYNESVWVQYSDAQSGSTAAYPIGSTSGLLVNLEACANCGVSGWGWQNGAYWLAQQRTITFATGGVHTIRIQMREDGVQIDQVVLSPSRYLTAAPGPVRNDATIVPQ
jgi:predicted amidohydrolase